MQRQCLKRQLMHNEIAGFTIFLVSGKASACINRKYVADGGWS
jgi:hypothetical protein